MRKWMLIFLALSLSGCAVRQKVKYGAVHTFPAEDTNNSFTGVNTFGNINSVLYVDGSEYTTVSAAITACGTSPCIVIVPSTYTGAAASSIPNNVQVIDLSQTVDVFGDVGPVRVAQSYASSSFGNLSVTVLTGTVTLTNGSTTVSGVGTHFTTQLEDAGAPFYDIRLASDAESAWVRVASVSSDTSATLVSNYAGTGGSGIADRVLTQLTNLCVNNETAGQPNTGYLGESVCYSAFSNRSAGGRPIWTVNWNASTSNQNNLFHGEEMDCSNNSGTDWPQAGAIPPAGFDPTISLLDGSCIIIIDAGTNHGQTGIEITRSGSAGFQNGLIIAGYNKYGTIYSSGSSGSIAQHFQPPDNSSAALLIEGCNAACNADVWTIRDSGAAVFTSVQSQFFSTSPNFATSGTLNLASGDGIFWRNNANSADLAITKNTLDQLLWNGLLIDTETGAVDLTAQTAAVGTTTLYAVPATGAGQYRLTWNAKVTTAATTGSATSTLGALTIVYTDPDGTVQTITAAAQVAAGTIATSSGGNSTATVLLGLPMLLNCKASTTITYAMSYASNTANQMAYNLHIKLEGM